MRDPTPNEIKHALRMQGLTLKSFAARHNFTYRAVCEVVRGVRRGKFGEGREIRRALGLTLED